MRGWSFRTNINVVTMYLSTFFAEKVENQEKAESSQCSLDSLLSVRFAMSVFTLNIKLHAISLSTFFAENRENFMFYTILIYLIIYIL